MPVGVGCGAGGRFAGKDFADHILPCPVACLLAVVGSLVIF
jgi:hypothetical protein